MKHIDQRWIVFGSGFRRGVSAFNSPGISGKTELAILGAIFVLAVVPSAIFAVSHLPLETRAVPEWFGDEKHYSMAAQKTLDALTGNVEFVEAMEYLARKAPLYPLYLSLILGISSNSYSMVAIVQALTNASTCLLIYLMGKRLFGLRSALLASGLAIAYVPFVGATGNLLRETLASFLLGLTILFLTEGAATLGRRPFLWGGLCLGLTVLCDPAAQFLPLLFFIVLLVVVWQHPSRLRLMQVVCVFLLGLALTIGPWVALTKAAIGRPVVSADYAGGAGRGGFLNKVDSDGWKTTRAEDGAFVREATKLWSQSGEEVSSEDVLEAIEMASTSFRLQVASNVIRSTPVPLLAGVPVKNFYRLWTFPWNRYRYSFVLTYPQQVVFHRAIVCTALLGIPLSLVRGWKRSLAMIVLLAYVTLIWSLQSTEVRHNMALMPYMMIMASGALGFLVSVGREVRASPQRRRILIALGIFLGFCLLSMACTLPLVSLMLKGAPLLSTYYAAILVRNGLLLCFVPILYLLTRIRLARRAAALVSVFPIVLLLIGYDVQALTSKTWHGWTSRLSEPGQHVRQEIVLPEDFDLGWWRKGMLLIDMHSGPGKGYDLIVEVNGEQVMEYRNGLRIRADWWGYHYTFYPSRLEAQGRRPEDLRQWFVIPVDLPLLAGTDRVVVDLYLIGEAEVPGAYVDIYGDYAWTKGRIFQGPCFAVTAKDARMETSIYKYSYDDDYRLDCEVELMSDESRGSYFNGTRWSDSDLSERPGVQSGEFRIRLQLKRANTVITL